MNYQDINAETIDRWIREGWEWGKPISHESYEKAKQGEWNVLLTPTRPVPHRWFGELKGKKILGLASGGGQQMPIFAALGADCTVLDYSLLQCESERLVAQREGYAIRILRADMTKPLPFPDESFDLIFHPVSNCYVREVRPIWRECFRVLRHGGELLSGTDHFVNYIVDDAEERIVNALPFDPLKNPEQTAACSFLTPWRNRLADSWRRAFSCWSSMRTITARDGWQSCVSPAFWPCAPGSPK